MPIPLIAPLSLIVNMLWLRLTAARINAVFATSMLFLRMLVVVNSAAFFQIFEFCCRKKISHGIRYLYETWGKTSDVVLQQDQLFFDILHPLEFAHS